MYSFALISIFLLTIRAILKSNKALKSIKEMLSSKRWVTNLIVVISFIIYVIYITHDDDSDESERLKSALKKSYCCSTCCHFC